MKILYVTSEVSPYSESGGLADVLGALPNAIAKKQSDAEVKIISPLYKTTAQKYKDKMKKVIDLTFKLSWRSTGATVYTLNEGPVSYYFIENAYYFDREWLYGEFDDGERFAFFNTAVIEFLLASGDIPHIIHANDWQTALSVIYLKTLYSSSEILSNIKTVFSIHNIEYQGKYDSYILEDVFALKTEHRSIVEFNGCINLLKGALICADRVLTVSPSYNNELHHDYFSFGLAEIIRMISGKMCGILNGIDYSVFSTKDTESLEFTYDKRSLKSGKTKNKLAIQEELGLVVSEDIPLLTMISRLTDGKGIDLVIRIADELLSENIQMVILGTGEQMYENFFRSLDARYQNFRAIIGFDRKISKKLYAASDIFLMPSKREPCGLAQMIATAYGTVPIVHSVGGLKDSIIPYGYEGYNGFAFENYNAHELLFTTKSALNLYKDKKEWSQIRRNAINSNFSWDVSAEKYMDIYRKIIN